MTIIADMGDDFENVANILLRLEKDFSNAAKNLKMTGQPLDTLLIEQASLVGFYQTRHVELRTMRKYVESAIERARGKLWKHYTEKVQRELNYRDKDHYVNAEDRIKFLRDIYHSIAELEEQYEAMCDALKQKGFMLNAIVKLKVAAIDGAITL